ALVLGAYAILLSPSFGKVQFLCLGLLGAYYAATDGVLAALGSAALEPKLRASGLAALNTTVGLCKLCSSVLFGLLWTAGGTMIPVWIFAVGLTAAIVLSAAILTRRIA